MPSRPSQANQPSAIESLRRRARGSGARVVLAEGEDPRVLAAAEQARALDLCRPFLVGAGAEVETAARLAGVELSVPVLDPATDPDLSRLESHLRARLEARGSASAGPPERVRNRARELTRNPLYYAALLTATGRADGAVMGAVASTADTLRAAFACVGSRPGLATVSSSFLVEVPGFPPLVYSDCGVVPDPDSEQLADIAEAAVATARLLLDEEPRVALLSFSSHGSAEHEKVEKVSRAASILALRGVDFLFDGELQADAALVPQVAGRKAPGSLVAGRANVLIFPDLDAGNIGYKLSQRLAGGRAIGPLLQGLARPIHDLSRGASVDDIVDVMAFTALSAV